ncbi:hypothetical protein DFH06DRAFT_1466836 [Mycena polygramma]|nr:hypothetical protein DFH06DRAFT_1466836 [Mycena polygramma]
MALTLSVRELIWILQMFFPPELPAHHALYILAVLISLYPILALHTNQRRGPRQPAVTGWMKTIRALLTRAFLEEADPGIWTNGQNVAEQHSSYISNDLDKLYNLLGPHHGLNQGDQVLFRQPPPVLCTSRLQCKFCPPGDSNLPRSLRRRLKNNTQSVWLLDDTYHWVSAILLVGYCAACKADYYPDRITRPGLRGAHRSQTLEYDAQYLRVSKSGIWVHRKIALSQEKALNRFHSGWSNFADWLNDHTEDINVKFTYRQSQRLFLEHFSRRLLIAHGKAATFRCEAHSTAKSLAEAVRNDIGIDGGVLPTAMSHGCMDCTRVKQYRSAGDNEMNVGTAADVVGSEAGPAEEMDPEAAEHQPLPANMLAALPQQIAPPEGSPRGYCQMAVMDGKTITHKKCALDDCRRPLFNFKNGRFCEQHLDRAGICGIIPCGQPIRSPEALTCGDESHINWHKKYEDRFHRLTFPGVQRVIRRQLGSAESGVSHGVRGPSLQVQLQALGETPGDRVVHTFKAKTIYCLQTMQWACGFPIGWGKCYRAESASQVLSFIDKIWGNNPNSRPAFIVYDKACELLRHIVTQDVDNLWIKSTKFIVDAWHYIGHRATDLLCRTRCNPAPTDGSQPDLVLTEVDDNGTTHQTRAFNTETAEQLNSWLNGFESQLRQMTDVNFDFFVHVLMLIYGERVENQVVTKNRELSEEFWAQVNGTGDAALDSHMDV